MSHPVNRLDRFQRGVYKSKRRVSNFYIHMEKFERIFYTKKYASHYRNTTRKCSASCCGNRRKFFNELTLQELRYGQKPIYPDE